MLSPDDLERLSRYAAGELSAAERGATEEALRARPELRTGLERLRRLDAVFADASAASEAEAPPVLAREVVAVRRPARPATSWLPLAVAAALGALIASAVLLWPRTSPAPAPPLATAPRAPREIATAHGRALLADSAQVALLGEDHFRLEAGTAVFEGKVLAEADGTDVVVDGLVAVSLEPSAVVAHVTQVLGKPNLEDGMNKALIAGTTLAVIALQGHALAGTEEIPKGTAWSKKPPASQPPVASAADNGPCGPGTLDPGIDFGALRDVMVQLSPQFVACYQQGLAQNAGLKGEMTLKLAFEARGGRGKVGDAQIAEGATLGNPFVQSCVLDVLAKADFPTPRSGHSGLIAWPFRFDSRADVTGTTGAVVTFPGISVTPDTQGVSYSPDRPGRQPAFDLGTPLLTHERVSGMHSRGPSRAKVVYFELADFECPFCAKGHAVERKLYRDYGDRVRFVLIPFNLPFHKNARQAALAAEAAGEQGKYWDYVDTVFDRQDRLDRASLLSLAGELGLNVSRFAKDLDSPELARFVDHMEEVGNQHAVKATPTVFIDGQEIVGARAYEQYKQLLDQELAARP